MQCNFEELKTLVRCCSYLELDRLVASSDGKTEVELKESDEVFNRISVLEKLLHELLKFKPLPF